jgi:hypothetical protein
VVLFAMITEPEVMARRGKAARKNISMGASIKIWWQGKSEFKHSEIHW